LKSSSLTNFIRSGRLGPEERRVMSWGNSKDKKLGTKREVIYMYNREVLGFTYAICDVAYV
jgi:hypothetical protein